MNPSKFLGDFFNRQHKRWRDTTRTSLISHILRNDKKTPPQEGPPKRRDNEKEQSRNL